MAPLVVAQPVALYLVEQAAATQAEDAGRLGAVASGTPQGLPDHLPLDLFHRLGQGSGLGEVEQ